MSDTKNDEKLRILQERLAQIKQKQDTPESIGQQKEIVIEVATPKNEAPKKERKPLNLSWIKKAIIVGSVAYGIFYGYTNINFNSLIPNFSSEKISQELVPTQLEYKLNIKGNNIAIIRSFEDESSAKALVNDLKIKGFKCNYFYLPENSNLTDEVYQVFIGPYENEKETSQWIQNIDKKVDIIDLSNGRLLKEMKSNKLIAKEKAEQEKIAKGKAKQEKIAKEKAEQEKINNDNNRNEQSKLKKVVEEQEKFQLEKQELENEKKQLKKAIKQLEKDKKNLITKKIQNNTKIIINYTYDFNTTIEDEGILIIKNNANYPIIKQNFANISSQGGIEKIIKKAEYDLNTFGENIDGVYFEKSGTTVPIYNGKITEVSL